MLSSVNAKGLAKSGEMYVSDNWGTARYKLHIRVNAMLGSVEVIRDAR
jgi:hypothetical protein